MISIEILNQHRFNFLSIIFQKMGRFVTHSIFYGNLDPSKKTASKLNWILSISWHWPDRGFGPKPELNRIWVECSPSIRTKSIKYELRKFHENDNKLIFWFYCINSEVRVTHQATIFFGKFCPFFVKFRRNKAIYSVTHCRTLAHLFDNKKKNIFYSESEHILWGKEFFKVCPYRRTPLYQSSE